jgi:hypothetical protein
MGMKEEEVVTKFLAGTHGHHPTNDECIYYKYRSTAEWMLYFRHIDTCRVSDCPHSGLDIPLCPTLDRFLSNSSNGIIERITKFSNYPALLLLQSLEANDIWEYSKTT